MSSSLTDVHSADLPADCAPFISPKDPHAQIIDPPRAIAHAAWHSLFWLVLANAIGVLLGILLLVPSLNKILGEWTYGRWMPVHMNLELYGWASLPLVAFLFKVYGADRSPASNWCRPALWAWSASLGVGALTWLNGHSSGKLFLDWTGYSRTLFPLAITALWLVLAYSLRNQWRSLQNARFITKSAKILGLALLLAVPILIYVAASPTLYPPINPDTGGPTGASQLESTLVVVAILLLLPFGLTRLKVRNSWQTVTAWSIFAVEAFLCLGLGRADVSHHRPIQYISLASLLIWLPLTPAYYGAFDWHPNTRRWRIAFLIWWSILVPTGWCLFLPGVLDHFKFTDGLVGHSLLAMAGFTTSLLIFVMVQLLGDDGWIFNGNTSFYVWQGSVLAYVLLMTCAGWLEGSDPSFTIVPGAVRNSIYLARLVIGVFLFIASTDWLIDTSKLLREPTLPNTLQPKELPL
jgi:cytochrome c oxidase cbb3-type subunit I